MSWISDYAAMTPAGRSRRLTQAAGISTAILVCHPETWEEIQSLAAALQPKRAISGSPGAGDDDGLAEVALSGVALATLVQAMHEVMVAPAAFGHRFPPHDRATARRIYLAAARVVRRVRSDQSAAVPRIILDDRIAS